MDPPMMTSFCVDACIICDIDGFTGRNDNTDPGEAPPSFCTTTVHNGQWIAFIAGSERLRIRLDVSNCASNNRFSGLEVGIYEGINCENFKLVSNCNGDVPASAVFTAEDLTIGQYYYLVMDGNGGSICDWTFTVLEGDTRVDPLETSGTMDGEFEVCPNIEQIYTLDFPVGATEFRWELNNEILSVNAPQLPFSFPSTGLYTLCVTAFNACDMAPPTCRSILVSSIPPTDLGKIKICEGDNYEVADTVLNTTGFYEFHITTTNGCDSLVIVDFEATPASFTDFGRVNICEEDVITIGDQEYRETGFYEQVLTNDLGCDSTITLDLFVVICNIAGSIVPNSVVCNGENSGSIDFSVVRGTPPFTYKWKRLDNASAGSGDLALIGNTITLPDLARGPYFVTINDEFGDSTILIGEVPEPPILTFDWEVSDFSDFQVSCFGGTDGNLEIVPNGGVAPYAYNWENGPETANQQALAVGNYKVTLTDAVGCELVAEEEIIAPPSLIFMPAFINPSCEGLATGKIIVQDINGGIAPYSFNLNNQGFTTEEEYNNLSAGEYQIIAKDANGCELGQLGELQAPLIPEIDLGPDITISLADSYELEVASTTPIISSIWRDNPGLSCYDCLALTASPANRTTYALTLTSPDDCSTTDSLTIHVAKIRDVFVANAFSPNGDGINDLLVVNGGPEVTAIKTFRVFSRWGEQLYEQTNFLPNDASFGWNGTDGDQQFGNAVYIWIAEITFIDGETLVYSGDVAIVR